MTKKHTQLHDNVTHIRAKQDQWPTETRWDLYESGHSSQQIGADLSVSSCSWTHVLNNRLIVKDEVNQRKSIEICNCHVLLYFATFVTISMGVHWILSKVMSSQALIRQKNTIGSILIDIFVTLKLRHSLPLNCYIDKRHSQAKTCDIPTFFVACRYYLKWNTCDLYFTCIIWVSWMVKHV